MKARAGTGWQYVMTDLSLILFMLTAAALRDAPDTTTSPALLAVPAESEPVALWRGGARAPALRVWLDQAGHDPRLLLTVHAPLADAALAVELGRSAGRPARIVLDPQPGAATYAALTYDQGMAWRLQSPGQPISLPETLR